MHPFLIHLLFPGWCKLYDQLMLYISFLRATHLTFVSCWQFLKLGMHQLFARVAFFVVDTWFLASVLVGISVLYGGLSFVPACLRWHVVFTLPGYGQATEIDWISTRHVWYTRIESEGWATEVAITIAVLIFQQKYTRSRIEILPYQVLTVYVSLPSLINRTNNELYKLTSMSGCQFV